MHVSFFEAQPSVANFHSAFQGEAEIGQLITDLLAADDHLKLIETTSCAAAPIKLCRYKRIAHKKKIRHNSKAVGMGAGGEAVARRCEECNSHLNVKIIKSLHHCTSAIRNRT